MRQDPSPRDEDLALLYRADTYFRLADTGDIGYRDYFRDEHMYREYFRRRLRVLATCFAMPGELFEVGAAAGFALAEAKEQGWRVSGAELSPSAAAYARARFGIDVRVGGVEALPQDGRLDAVLAFQTIEHVPDVRMFLRRIHRAIRPGGLLLLTTPDHNSLSRRLMRRWWPSYRPEHLLYFDRRSLTALLTNERFVTEHVGADLHLMVPLSRFFERLLYYNTGRSWEPHALGRLMIPVWLGDMVVIARRSDRSPSADGEEESVSQLDP